MPLNTQIIRDGKPLKIKWGGFHVVAMTLAAAFDSGEGPFDGAQKPKYTYTEGEYKGKTEADYPDVPCPISQANLWDLMGYHVISTTPLNRGGYKLKNKHRFLDITDNELLELLPGDELIAYRGG